MMSRIRKIAWIILRRLRPRLIRDGLLNRKIIKMTGIGNKADKTEVFISVSHFLENIRTFFPGKTYDYLIAQNFLHDEFVSCRKPKIFFTLEPPPLMTPETRKNLRSKELQQYLYRYDEQDIRRRMFYPSLPYRREEIIRKLERSIAEERPKLCCIINRYSEADELDLLRQRVNFVEAAGRDIDIYGLEPWSGPNKWTSFPNYFGASENKQETLKRYTFTLSFENCDCDGYISEKINHAFMAGTIPLYWGGGSLLKDTLPSNCYIDCRDQDPNLIFEMIKKMSRQDIISYRKAAIDFLKSDLADRFTYKYLAREIVCRLEAMDRD